MIRTRCSFAVWCLVAWSSVAAAQSVTIDATRTGWFNRAGKGGPGWAGGDVGASVRLPDGRSVWTWGDTFYGTVSPTGLMNFGWRFVQGNALVVTSNAGAFTSVFGPGPSALIKPATSNSWYWMADGTLDAGRLRIFLNEFYRTGTGAWDFAWTGNTSVASFSLSTGQLENVNAAIGSGNGIAWGSAIMEEGAYFYIYGDEAVPIPGFGTWHRTHVARATQSAGLFGPWEYFNGATWVGDKTQSRAMTLTGTTDNFSQVSGVRRLPDGRYAMLSMLFPGTTIDESYAPTPQGPWANHIVLYRPPETGVNNQFCYMARYHPQFDVNGATSIGYSVNGAPWGTNFYRPRFILVQR